MHSSLPALNANTPSLMVERYPDNDTFAQLRDQRVEDHFKVNAYKSSFKDFFPNLYIYVYDFLGCVIYHSRFKVFKTRAPNWY
jgi:hypothetical protein